MTDKERADVIRTKLKDVFHAEVIPFNATAKLAATKAQELREAAALIEKTASEGWAKRIAKMEAHLALNKVNGGVGHLKSCSFDQVIVIYPGDEIHVRQQENGKWVDHWIAPTRRKEKQTVTQLDGAGETGMMEQLWFPTQLDAKEIVSYPGNILRDEG